MLRRLLVATATGSVLFASASIGSRIGVLFGTPVMPAQAAPSGAYDPYNSSFPIERGECLAVSLGSNAASECGDLRVEHALPSVRVFNSTVTPTLLYNSRFAHPYGVVPIRLTQLSTTTTPDSVEVQIFVYPLGGSAPPTPRVTRRWAGSEWPSGQTTTRRITIAYDAINDTTGIWYNEARIANVYPGNVKVWQSPFLVTSQFLVNRSQSPFGAGWWPVGLEEVKKTYTPPGGTQQYYWVGGDGSTRIFIQGYANLYDRLDSLQVVSGSMYIRRLPEGRRVEFDWSGRHVKTINRFGRTTTFSYSLDTLKSIALPSPTGLTFYYDYTAGKLDSVRAPALGGTTRAAQVTISAGNLTSIKNSGDSVVSFSYLSAAPHQYLMNQRTNRRNVPTTFTYDSALKVRTSSLSPGSGGGTITLTVLAGESRGLPNSGPPTSSVDTLKVYTKIDGPRPSPSDTTIVFQEAFGSPRRSIDAAGAVTRMKRRYIGADWPGYDECWVLHRVQRPLGQVVRYVWDDYPNPRRGNLLEVWDSTGTNPGVPDITRYVWDQTFDQLLRVVPPENDSVVFGIDPSNGRRDWQQDARGTSSRINFYYDATYAEQVTSMVLPGGATHSFTYHPTLRNVWNATTPLGYVTTNTYDPIGRVITVASSVDENPSSTKRLQRFIGYDLRDLPTSEKSATNEAQAETLFVSSTHNAEGQVESVSRWSWPDSTGVSTITNTTRYDDAGRVRAEVRPNVKRDSLVYDEASNLTKRITAEGDTIKMLYDARNLLVKRIVPERVQADKLGPLPPIFPPPPQPQPRFPYFHQPLSGGGFQAGLKIFADTSVFTYDLEGRLKSARNRDAHIGRTYTTNGRLQTDTQKIAVYDRVETPTSLPYDSHVYVFSFTYDRNGRRLTRSDPSNLGSGQQTLVYHPQLGALDSLKDRAANGGSVTHSAGFVYDLRSRLTSRSMGTGTVVESWTYDDDDRVLTRLDEVLQEVSTYDGRGKREQVTITSSLQGLAETVTHEYDGLGALSRMISTKGSGIDDQYWTDALGNVLFTDGLYGDTRSKYAHDRPLGPAATILETRLPGNPPSDTIADDLYMAYDSTRSEVSSVKWVWFWNGNWSAQFWPSKGSTWTWNAYSGDGRLRVSQRSWNDAVTNARRHSFVEHRYDALGRRVLTRTQADSLCTQAEPDCMSTMERFIWDGDQVLFELRAKMPYTTHGWALEAEQSSGNFYGSIRYAHAGDMDRPVLIWKDLNTPIVPHWNFRGMAVSGSDPTNGNPIVNMSWPGRDRGAYFGPDTRVTPTIPTHWLGSLTDGQSDATGLLYRRNRYFNPGTAQFNQEDPIGLAGGLNLHGFADGDPANFMDPFGLCPECRAGDNGVRIREGFWNRLKHGVYEPCSSDHNADCTPTPLTGVVPSFFGGPAGASRVLKAANLPAWRKVAIDMEHVAAGHIAGGTRVSAGKTLFPQAMSLKQVERAIRQAYRYSEKVASQGDRVLLRGEGSGMAIEMWLNRSTRVIETAYPVFR